MTKAAFQGSYADLKFIKSRSVAQIVIELPIEQAGAFVAAFGAPVPGSECPVAIARLEPARAVSKPPEPKKRRKFNELPLAQQAAMRCNDEAFAQFAAEMLQGADRGLAECIRFQCGVKTRSDIIAGTPEGNRWLLIESAYQAWLRAPEHVV